MKLGRRDSGGAWRARRHEGWRGGSTGDAGALYEPAGAVLLSLGDGETSEIEGERREKSE